jgi:hypothetical protein
MQRPRQALRGGVGKLRLDESALPQIIAGNDEVGGFHVFDPGGFVSP